MSELIVDKYANLLATFDVIKLFKLLEDMVGSRVKAAEVCGLERKTIYDWEETGEMKLRTKKKVLTALLEKLPDDTLEFMMKRSVESSCDIIRICLTYIYEHAMDEAITANNFKTLASRFDYIRNQYSGLITNYMDIEVGDMYRFFNERARDFDLDLPKPKLNLVKLSSLSEMLPEVIRMIRFEPSIIQVEKHFNLPSGFVQSLSTALQESFPAISPPILSIQPISPEHGYPRIVGTMPELQPRFTYSDIYGLKK